MLILSQYHIFDPYKINIYSAVANGHVNIPASCISVRYRGMSVLDWFRHRHFFSSWYQTDRMPDNVGSGINKNVHPALPHCKRRAGIHPARSHCCWWKRVHIARSYCWWWKGIHTARSYFLWRKGVH